MVDLEPFGDPSLDNAIVLPIGLSVLAMAPDEETGDIPPEVSPDAPQEPEPAMPPMPLPGTPAAGGAAPAGPPNQLPKGTPPAAMPPAMQRMQQAVANAAKGELRAKAASVPTKVGGKRVMGTGTKRLRQELDQRLVPRVQSAVAGALDRQGDAIAAAVEKHWAHISQKPGDESAWWREGDVERTLLPGIGTMAEQVEDRIRDTFGR